MKDLTADLEVAQSAASGDERAWREIVDHSCRRLFALLCYQVGDREEALDLLQETYVQAFLLGYESRAATAPPGPPPVAGTDLTAGSEATALYEIKLRGPLIPGRVATATVYYTPARADQTGRDAARDDGGPADRDERAGNTAALLSAAASIEASEFAGTFAAASPRFRVDAVAARFAEILRHRHGWTGDRLALVLPMARRLAAEVRDPAVTELADLIARAEEIADRMVLRP